MTPEQQKEFDDYSEMFGTEGWRTLIKGTTQMKQDIMDSSVAAAQTNDQWQFLRGQVSQLNAILGFENYIAAAQAASDEEDNPEDMEVSDLEA